MRMRLLLLSLLCFATQAAQAGELVPARLRCEYRVNPLGIDSPAPRLDWILQAVPSTARGQRQSAYRVLAASDPDRLAKGQGNLWDSGLVRSGRMSRIAYAGRPLLSGAQCWWKVRVADQAGHWSEWSAPAQWTMGLLQNADWHGARWIGASAAAVSANAAGLIGYHAAEAQRQDEVKWVGVDLGKPRPISRIALFPMQHAHVDGFGFPLRFKIEASEDADFAHPRLIADQTPADSPSPGVAPVVFPVAQITARFVRVTATKLWLRDASITGRAAYAFALRRLQVDSGGRDAAAGAVVTAKDSVESSEWGRAALTAFAPPTLKAASTDSILLRRQFTVRPRLVRALAFACGLGQYEMTVNGGKAGDDLLAPGWTKYGKTCLYDTHDITKSLHAGENALGLFLGNGMYNIHPGRYTKITGSFGPPRAVALIRLDYADGTRDTIVTDEHWRAGAGPITFSSVYGGEDYDARLAPSGWDRPGFDDSQWDAPVVTQGPGGALRGLSAAGPPIRGFAVLRPVSHAVLSASSTVYDLGQNASLMLRLQVRGHPGASVRITPSELVHPNGDIDDQMCDGQSFWTYTLSGQGTETFASHFYYRGGRFLKVDLRPAPGESALPVVVSLAAQVIHADAPPVGRFSCSSDLYNKVAALIRWAQQNNMVSIMTDCPTREKLGWLEEDHLNGPALRFNFDMSTMMTKMTADMADSQRPNGLVPSTCPDYPHWDEGMFTNPPEWGSAAIAVPWQQYEFEGDLALLRRCYPMMTRYLGYLRAHARGQIVSFGLGDWYDNQQNGTSTLTPVGLTATAFYYYDARTVAHVALLLGKTGESAQYNRQADEILAAFNRKYFNADQDTYATGSQASIAFPLALGLVPPAHRPAVLENLVRDLKAKGSTAGEVSLKMVLDALAASGRSDLIDAVYGSDKSGYGLQVAQGKTSLAEGWNGSASQDHFMFGQINEWFYRSLAGIGPDPDGPGFQKIWIKPAPVGSLAWARARYDSIEGRIESAWKRTGQTLTLDVAIPPNTTATVWVPARDPDAVRESGQPAVSQPGVRFLRRENGAAVYAVGSGRYQFTSTLAPLPPPPLIIEGNRSRGR